MQKPLPEDQLENLTRFAQFGKLTSGLVHELVNPLTVILLNLEQLNAESKRLQALPEYYKNVQQALKKAIMASRNIENYIVSLQQQIQHQEIKKRFSVYKEISYVLHMYAYRIAKDHVTITMDFGSKPYLYGNPIKFNQCISNLLSNALDSFGKQTASKNKEIRINITHIDKRIVVSITDTGCGIGPDDLKHIFDPFFTQKSDAKGTGIGLAMTKEIVEKNFHGRITAKSTLGAGTTLTLSLPSSVKASLSPKVLSQ